MTRRKELGLFISGVLFLAAGILGLLVEQSVVAQDVEATPTAIADEPANDETQQPSDAYCLLCHSQSDRSFEFPNGDIISLTIDHTVLDESVHGTSNPDGPVQCADCHLDHRFPHDPQISKTKREFELQRYASCRNCHENEYTYAQDSVHAAALREQRVEAATCVDCHGGHDVQPPSEPRQRVSFTCGKCHGAIFDQYQDSVHGEALLDDSNPDVPTCIDCHGVHDIQDPTTSLFRVRSPQLCADCHADDDLMNKYEISTEVFDSYLSDFHGSTVALFEQHDPSVATNKAVCYDCHGVHNILSADDEGSQVMRENLLTTCQECHPDATTNFSDAWLGHYAPSLEHAPLLFLVQTFYKILIPAVVGAFILLIVTDIVRRIRERLSRN